MIGKIPDIKKTIKKRGGERMVKVLVSVCKANKGERERKNRDLQQKLEKQSFVFCDGEKDLLTSLEVY